MKESDQRGREGHSSTAPGSWSRATGELVCKAPIVAQLPPNNRQLDREKTPDPGSHLLQSAPNRNTLVAIEPHLFTGLYHCERKRPVI